MDEFNAARGVRRADAPRALHRAPDASLDPLLDAFLDANQNMGLLVLKGDQVLAERYQYGRTDGHRFGSASVAKTILGMLTGIALAESKISSIDDRADQYVAELKGHPYGEVTVRQLLTMSSGMADDELRLIFNTVRQRTNGGADTVLEFSTREAPAGTRFRYANADSQVLGLVLIWATKTPLATYLSEKIWQPMGAEAHATWLVDKGGFETGYCCINATLRDFARFGMLLANYGQLDGKQIIPEAWVRASTVPDAPYLAPSRAARRNGYGYQTWLIGGSDPPQPWRFAALGVRGQAIFIDAMTKLVVVHSAVWEDGRDRAARGRQFRLWESLLAKYSQ
jgi:CubicO group peptidase (beta-lactamase class C family)